MLSDLDISGLREQIIGTLTTFDSGENLCANDTTANATIIFNDQAIQFQLQERKLSNMLSHVPLSHAFTVSLVAVKKKVQNVEMLAGYQAVLGYLAAGGKEHEVLARGKEELLLGTKEGPVAQVRALSALLDVTSEMLEKSKKICAS